MSIDVAEPFKAADAMIDSMTWCQFRDAILLTDVRRHSGIASHAAKFGIRVINHAESNRIAKLPGITRQFYPDYERAQLTEPANHVGDSSHVLYMESDAGVLNHEAWNPFWYSYDFIGAPWPRCFEPGYPACDGETNAVGNTGFSLRSRKFCHASADCFAKHQNDQNYLLSDAWLCRTHRSWLEREHKVEFAPADVAARFSCENKVYTGQFGFHGKATMRLNGWPTL